MAQWMLEKVASGGSGTVLAGICWPQKYDLCEQVSAVRS